MQVKLVAPEDHTVQQIVVTIIIKPKNGGKLKWKDVLVKIANTPPVLLRVRQTTTVEITEANEVVRCVHNVFTKPFVRNKRQKDASILVLRRSGFMFR